jgi:murein L,D-transpeptidase YcbB/YkuD
VSLLWKMKYDGYRWMGACIAGGLILASSFSTAEPELEPQAGEIRDALATIVGAMGLDEDRREELVDDLLKLHPSREASSLAQEPVSLYAGKEGQERIRNFMLRHGFLPEELEGLKADPEAADEGLAVWARLLHARRLLRDGPPRMAGHWPEWDRGETPGKASEDEEEKAVASVIEEAGDGEGSLLDSFLPKNIVYQALAERFHEMSGKIEELQAEFSAIPAIADGEIVKPGDSYPGTAILVSRLVEEGYLDADQVPEGDPDSYTEEISEAVKRFQRAHGRSDDGILGPDTLAELNRSPRDELEILRINLHRARLLPDEPGERYVMVNVPSARVFAFEGEGEPKLQMRVIVGETVRDRQTPVFRDVMKTLEFGPPWNVPTSIASRDLVPRARKDHGYLERNRYEIVESFGASGTVPVSSSALSRVESGNLFLRQKPGPNNALGSVKFLFPNDYAIYLHDTPNDELFEESERNFSNGCIRVEDPAALAEYVLGGQGWDRDRVVDRLENATTEVVEIENPINIYIVYFTAFPEWEKDGGVRFYPDIYGQDKALLERGEEG